MAKPALTGFPLCFFVIMICLYNSPVFPQTPVVPRTVGTVERMDPELDKLLDTNSRVEMIADGFGWVEGPVWAAGEQMLLFSDILKNRIYKWTAQGGTALYLEPSGYTQATPRGHELGSNGLAINGEGQLVLCQHGDRRIALMNASLNDPKPLFTTLAGQYQGKKFNSPNDLAIRRNGDIYFTDPPYGLENGAEDPARELPYQGVYKISKDGTVTLLVDSLTRPNGIAFFPGEKRLLIANSDDQKPYWYVYDLDQQGNLVDGQIFVDGSQAFQKEKRSPDGIKIDKKGHVFAAGPGGIWIFNRHGKALGRIKTEIITSNCALSSDNKALFITANHCILRVQLK